MFDKYITHSVSSPSTIKVEEKRAPTDDSIRLAEEYKEKITKEIVSSYVFDNPNQLSGMSIEFCYDALGIQRKMYVRFILNGKEIVYNRIIKNSERETQEKQIGLLKDIANGIAAEIVLQFLNDGKFLSIIKQ